MTPPDPTAVVALHDQGLGYRAIAERLEASPWAVRRILAAIPGLVPAPAGRPSEGRTITIAVRLTPAEAEAVVAAAGDQAPATWARTVLVYAARDAEYPAPTPTP